MVSKHVGEWWTALALFAGSACAASAVIWSINGNAVPDTPSKCPVTAAATHGWGAPIRSAGFDSPAELDNWWLYDGPGHAGNGRRTPAAISGADGYLTIDGDAEGNSGGVALKGPGQVHGRWEACVKSLPSAPGYHSVLLLWPDAENWPVGGEIDFMEIADPTRQTVEGYLHYGTDDQRQGTTIPIDATQWHSFAVEWTPERIAFFVDGVQWWETRDTGHFPPGPMHLCMQLDNFGGNIAAGGRQRVDWAGEYALA
jgi:licheninase